MSAADDLKAAQAKLVDEAINLAAGDIHDLVQLHALYEAADAYARARWSTKTGANGRVDKKPSTSLMKLPFGRAAGQTIGEAPSVALRFVAEHVKKTLGGKPQYRAKDEQLLAAINTELKQRGDV